jgi:molybdopterin synthase sulfur carrier subunit
MEIELLAFGITKDIIGERKTKLSVKEGVTVKELKELLHSKYPELVKLKSLAIACNETYALDEETIPSMCTVALIPPVSGG